MTDVLAIDLATTCGFARGMVGTRPVAGSIRFGAKSASANAVFGASLRWIAEVLKPEPRPDVLIIEAMLPAAARLGATSKVVRDRLAGLHGVVRGVAFLRGIRRIEEASVLDVRGHFIGVRGLKRDVAKNEVVLRCRQLGWLDTHDDDAGDACALWSYACGLIDPKTALQVSPLFNRALRIA
jgi:hypothetical protein